MPVNTKGPGKTEAVLDPSAVLKMFSGFDEKTRKRVFRSTLRKSANIVIRQTQKNLRDEIGDAADEPNRWDGHTLAQGVTAKISKNYRWATISIMGDFRLKFFELGTDDRYTLGRRHIGKRYVRRGSRRGAMTARYFFRSAKRQTEQIVFSSISKNLAKTIERINKKKHG